MPDKVLSLPSKRSLVLLVLSLAFVVGLSSLIEVPSCDVVDSTSSCVSVSNQSFFVTLAKRIVQ